jgi:glycosyltransferase involved in cell wall biosynthesis
MSIIVSKSISIVMAYFNDRKEQIIRTLDRFEDIYYNKYNFEVIIVDDNTDENEKLDNIIKKYSFKIILINIDKEEKGSRVNPCKAYNKGFKYATGEIIIIQNPECYHVNDILKYTINYLEENQYFSFSCYTTNTKELNDLLFSNSNTNNDILYFIKKWYNETILCSGKNPNLKIDHPIEWYCHPYILNSNTAYHYCSAIYKTKLDILGGFDETFSDGYCFDDNEILLSIKYKLNLNIKIIDPDFGLVIHQFHKRCNVYNIKNDKNINIFNLWDKNKKLYISLIDNYIDYKDLENIDTIINEDGKIKVVMKFLLKYKLYKRYDIDKMILNEKYLLLINKYLDKILISTNINNKSIFNNRFYHTYDSNFQKSIPKIAFTYWDMSSLTFMHFLTLFTIKKQNPDWKIVVYYPKKKINIKTWISDENKMNSKHICYLSSILNLDINIIEIDFEIMIPEIPFYLPEIIKSDMFRIIVLKYIGGVWFDMDTFWINSLTNTFKLNNYSSFDNIKELCQWHDNNFNINKNSFSKNSIDENSYYVLCNRNQDNNNNNYCHFCQYILLSNKYSKITNLLYNKLSENLDIDKYESIGTPMFNKYVTKYMLENENDWDKNIININIFAPYKWYEMIELFENNNDDCLTKVKNSCCLHWFNGSSYTKKFIHKFNHINNNFDNNFLQIYNKNINDVDKKYIDKLKKISIVMSYYNRKTQLIHTLESIMKSTYKNIEIIIVDDNSDEEHKIEKFIDPFKKIFDIKVIVINNIEKTWVNPCIGYNIGLKEATGDIIILQNPEVCHIGDCIQYVLENLNIGDWLSFNCFGSHNYEMNELFKNSSDDKIFDIINNLEFKEGGNSIIKDDVGGWLNHYTKHFVAYHYCAAIHKYDLVTKMDNGFNEIFKDGIGADDDEFIKRLIKNKFKFKINKFENNDPFVVHQFHDKPNSLKQYNYLDNRKLFNECCIKMNYKPENNIKLAPIEETPAGNILLI